MNELSTVSPETSLPPSFFSPKIGYSQASAFVCVPASRQSHRTIISYHNSPPSRILHPGHGIDLHVAFLETHDGLHVRYARFKPADKLVGNTYVFLEGKSVPIEGLQKQIEYIVRRGHQVFTMDWRSQGLSSRTVPRTDKVHVRDFLSEYGADLGLYLDKIVLPQQKGRLFLVAYSMGAAITITTLMNNLVRQDDFDDILLMAPLMEAKELTSMKGRMALPMARFAQTFGFSEHYCWTTGDRDWKRELQRHKDYTLEREELEIVARRCRDEPRVKSGGPTWAWIEAYKRYVTSLHRMPPGAIGARCTIVLASHDRIVTNEETVRLSRHLMANCRYHNLAAAHALEMGGPDTIRRVGEIILETSSTAPARPRRVTSRRFNTIDPWPIDNHL